MESRPSGLTTPAAIVLGSALIAASILLSGGVFGQLGALRGGVMGGQPLTANPSVAPASAAPSASPQPPPVGNLPVQGQDSAKVTVIEFADFQCPFCGAVSGLQPNGPVTKQLTGQDPTWQPYESSLVNDYVKTGKVKFAYRDFAFLGQESNDAANAARCANEQGHFWDYHDKLFASQSGENQGAFSKDKLKQFAVGLGLDATKFNNCVDTDKYAQAVQDDTAAGRAAGVNGTPALFINGQMISGAVPYATVKTQIEAALAAAK